MQVNSVHTVVVDQTTGGRPLQLLVHGHHDVIDCPNVLHAEESHQVQEQEAGCQQPPLDLRRRKPKKKIVVFGRSRASGPVRPTRILTAGSSLTVRVTDRSEISRGNAPRPPPSWSSTVWLSGGLEVFSRSRLPPTPHPAHRVHISEASSSAEHESAHTVQLTSRSCGSKRSLIQVQFPGNRFKRRQNKL